MRQVRVAKAAQQDLRAIWEYLAPHNSAAASRILKEITSKFTLLRE